MDLREAQATMKAKNILRRKYGIHKLPMRFGPNDAKRLEFLSLKKLILASAALILLFLCACAMNPKASTVPGTLPTTAPALPNGARDAVDANTYRVVKDAYALLKSIKDSVDAGTLTLTKPQKDIYNKCITSYDIAYVLGKSYHDGTSTNAASLNTATANLQADFTAAQTSIAVPPK